MRNRDLAGDHVRRADARLRAIEVLFAAKSWADVVRESQEVVELAIPFAELAVLPETELRFRLAVRRGGRTVEEWPDRGFLVVAVPTEDFEAEMWSA